MDNTNKRITIFALKTLRDILSYPKEDLTGAHIALKFVNKMISDGVPGIHERDVVGAIYIIANAILELEGGLEEQEHCQCCRYFDSQPGGF